MLIFVKNAFRLSSNIIPKIQNYYEAVIPKMDLSTFKSHFRMSPDVFEIVLGRIANNHNFQKDYHHGGRQKVDVEKMVLIAIWTLATPESYRSVGDRFGVTKSMVFHCLHSTVKAILEDLCRLFIKWPLQHEKQMISTSFNKYGLSGVIGVIDGCHIPIKKPLEHPSDYFNRKKFYSMILQGVCKNDLSFIDVDVRWPGGVHDARVLRTSSIYPIGAQLCGDNYYILGDSAYPVLSWLIPPFKNNGHLTPAEVYFNKMLSKTRVKIEHAFGALKGRFRRLKEFLDIKETQNIANIIVASCVLHNICIMNNDDPHQYIDPGFDVDLLHIENLQGYNDLQGIQLRNQLVLNLWNNRPQRI